MLGSIRVALVLAIAIGAASPAFGQYRSRVRQSSSQVPRYIPATPTVSPYLSLLNRDGGPASNYYGLVRPLQRQQAINEAQRQTLQFQEQQITSVRDQQEAFGQPTVRPTGTAGWFQNPGTTPQYQVPSHYYGQWQTRGGAPQRGRSGR